jgi:penicillin-binding protein-related factor A (putative recombinase)
MNAGKRFEEQIKKSCKKQGIYYYRLRDTSNSWNKDEDEDKEDKKKIRFTPKNLSDFILHYDKFTIHFEAKTHLGKSIPQKAISQAEKMAEVNHQGVLCLFALNYREVNETYLIAAKDIMNCLSYRKSVDLQFCRDHGILIPQKLKRVNYFFDIRCALEKFINNL